MTAVNKTDCCMTEALKIAVLDDHRMFLEGISLVVKGMASRFEVEGFDTPSSLLARIQDKQKFNLIVCDLVMNQMNGLAFVAAARVHDKQTPILILSGINTDPPINEIKRLGANGFIHKSAENKDLLNAINVLISGAQYFEGVSVESEKSAPHGDAQEKAYDMPAAIPILGKRQIEVLRMIANGASNKEISSSLTISENTVKTHLRQIFEELAVNKRTACVRKAQALGII
ncbi:response regulator transcription factor [Kordiimonas aquimaris]|uniref:response regulator transcription factor n=1 Tax=Kordiimonas aquimaris TaxID=707591 RepID=UPI0021CF9AAE|nr:response regulator transcription factor [Kordiimonas aquimaris]